MTAATSIDLPGFGLLPGKWADRALCAEMNDPDLWFPATPETAERNVATKVAVGVCKQCPVRTECLQFALSVPPNEAIGIWGATTDRERQTIRRRWRA